jgi:hypothetical protein
MRSPPTRLRSTYSSDRTRSKRIFEVIGLQSPLVNGRLSFVGPMLKTYRGSCHCGSVTFEAELDLAQPTFRCNCSICRRTRFWAVVVRSDGFRLLTGEPELIEYRFNTRKNQHFFCKHCGVRPFGVGNDTPIGKMIGVNVGCLEGLDDRELSTIPLVYVDGRHDRWPEPPPFHSHL